MSPSTPSSPSGGSSGPSSSLPSSGSTGSGPSGPRGPRRRASHVGRNVAIAAIIVIVIVAGVAYYAYGRPKASSGGGGTTGCGSSETITVWQDFSETEFPAFAKAVGQYETANPCQSVSWVNETTPSPSNYVTAALAGDAPNILIGASDFAGGLWYDGFLVNLSSAAPSSDFTPFISSAVADVTQDGSIFGFPLNVNGVAMIYNKQLVPVAPTNTDQMISDAENITVNTTGTISTAGLIYALDSDGGYRYPAWQSGFGGQMFMADGAPDLNTSASTDALTFVNNFSAVYRVEPPDITSESTWEGLFSEGKVGMIFDGPWDIEEYVDALGAANVGVAPIPIVSQTGDHPMPFWGSIGAYVSTGQVSGADSTLVADSVQFAQFLASPTVEGELFNSSGDIPSLTSVFHYVQSLNIPFENGFLTQFIDYSQPFPNTVQMTYFWDPYNTEISDYLSGQTSASGALGAIQSAIIGEMMQNSVSPY